MVRLPVGVDANNLIEDLRIFSWEAADILLYYSNLLNNKRKKNNIILSRDKKDPVTIADLKVNELIIRRINEKYENINWKILSEENAKNTFESCETSGDWLWILDPLDGTKDFIQRTGNYAMHLALNFKQKPILGVVLVPEKNELWFSNGEKAWGEKRDRTQIKPNLAKKISLQKMILITSKNHRNEELKKLIKKIYFEKVIIKGSIGCKFVSIIKGESDIYISLSLPNKSSPKDWDFAAPEAILRAAGGAVTNIDNKELSYNQKNYEHGGIIVASSNKEIHHIICSEIKQIIKEYNLFPFAT